MSRFYELRTMVKNIVGSLERKGIKAGTMISVKLNYTESFVIVIHLIHLSDALNLH